jgi:hypothetical protein
MLEPLTLLVLAALFGFGYATRTYVGALVPVVVLVCAVILYSQSTPSGDEVDVLPAMFVFASAASGSCFTSRASPVWVVNRTRRPSADQQMAHPSR